MSKKKKTNISKGKGEIDAFSLITSLLFGAAWCIFGGMLYRELTETLPMCFVMSIYFGGLAITLLIVTLLCNAIKGYNKVKKKDYTKIAATFGAIITAATVFQLIYGIDIKVKSKITNNSSFIFAIDNSGSMSDSDPDGQRYEAIKAVMNAADSSKQFCVYSFENSCSQLTDMLSASEAKNLSFENNPGGGTYMFMTIDRIVDDISNKTINVGNNPRIILLTDGYSSDGFIGAYSTLSRAAKKNISICAVGFGDCDDQLLQNIADMTGGKYVKAANASELASAMIKVANATSDYKRNLINHREPSTTLVEIIYAAERIIFLVALGACFMYLKSLLIRTNDAKSNLLLLHIIIISIGALCIEVGMNILYFDEVTMRTLMCICFTIIVTSEVTNKIGSNYGGWSSSNGQNKFSVGGSSSSNNYDSSTYDDLYN